MEPNHYSEIGELLRLAREESNLSKDSVSRILHIRARYLDALEEGRLHELPGLAYTRGYLQAYAAFLGLDKDEILRRFEETEALLGRKNFYFPQVFSKEKSPNRWIIWGSLALGLISYCLWEVLLHPVPEPISEVEKLSERQPPETNPHVHVSIETLHSVACLRRQGAYYPPCTMALLHSRHVSVMELKIQK